MTCRALHFETIARKIIPPMFIAENMGTPGYPGRFNEGNVAILKITNHKFIRHSWLLTTSELGTA
jgi:hypothetical protein